MIKGDHFYTAGREKKSATLTLRGSQKMQGERMSPFHTKGKEKKEKLILNKGWAGAAAREKRSVFA